LSQADANHTENKNYHSSWSSFYEA
jgi:hypothetical protein